MEKGNLGWWKKAASAGICELSRKAVAIREKNQAGVVASTYNMAFGGDPLLQIGREDLDMDSGPAKSKDGSCQRNGLLCMWAAWAQTALG